MASVIVHHLSSHWLQCPVIYLPIVRHPINGNLIPQLFLWLTFESKKETFTDSRQVNVGMRLLIDASQVHFQRILSRCKWCCVIIVDLTSFFPSKEFLLVLESYKIAMKASSWKLTKIIKGSIISPLSASLGWNCVNLLVFCSRGKWRWMPSKYATRDLLLRPLIGHLPHTQPLIGQCPGLLSPLCLVWMAQTRWHWEHDTACHNMSQPVMERDML